MPLVGLGRFELPTSRLSGVRSNQLSYRPVHLKTNVNSGNKSVAALTSDVFSRLFTTVSDTP